MNHGEFECILTDIISSLKSAGYDPYEQITGYLQTGNDLFITRFGGAREKIRQLDKRELERCLEDKRS
ncbi:IreB family regulatory phosphoprotein [Ructibacterium gallinarum]|uniref:IreB family regulatory phosphoprotein n=1 Tax=Ructibacterium gallinarum TaxID=2779355 RepID=A0A9D5R8V0_9FIRM|nr:IreB family regulatory phosphoprotein [Ructibacterium gallinarum]MBE5040796.1 IreB family regulatory phosphoprotein [Ructibacterium gallinarum]